MRICSLLPSTTEIAFALGLGDAVVGVTHECDYPPEAKKKPVVVRCAFDAGAMGSGEIDRTVSRRLQGKESLYLIDLSRLKEANPDLILTQDLCDVCAIEPDEVLKAAASLPQKPQLITLAPHLLGDMLKDIERVGEATARQGAASSLIENLRRRIHFVTERAKKSAYRPRVACLEWLDPLYNAGHWIPEMVELAGGTAGLAEKGKPSTKINWEGVIEFSPEVIVVMPCGFDVARTLEEMPLIQRLPGWNDLPAVKQGQVFAVNGHAYFSRSGPRLVDALEILAHILHPELFPDDAPPDAARRLANPGGV